MSIGPEILAVYVAMVERGLFDSIRTVMEFGDQEYTTKGQPQLLDRLFQLRGVNATHAEFSDPGEARLIYERLGLRYACLDTNEGYGAMLFDLNFDTVPAEHRAQYDLVTNFGTTEHVFNQANAFRVMHDFTRPGGYMLHFVPFMGYVSHGLYCYQPAFFESLARANRYEVVGLWAGTGPNALHMVPWNRGLLQVTNTSNADDCMIAALLRRSDDAAFEAPMLERSAFAADPPAGNLRHVVVDAGHVEPPLKGIAEETSFLAGAPTPALKVWLEKRFGGG